MNNYGFPPIYQLPGGFDLDAFIKFQEYMKNQNPSFNKAIKSKSEIKDFLRLWNAFKEADEKKQKEEAEKKKKDEEEKKKKEAAATALPTFTFTQVFVLMLAFGLPVGSIWFVVMDMAFRTIKGILFP